MTSRSGFCQKDRPNSVTVYVIRLTNSDVGWLRVSKYPRPPGVCLGTNSVRRRTSTPHPDPNRRSALARDSAHAQAFDLLPNPPIPRGREANAEWRVARAEGRGRGVGRNTARFRRSFLRSGLSPTPVSQATAAPVVGLKPGLHGLRLRGGGSPCGYSAPGAGGSLCGQPLNLDFVGMLLGLREVVEHLLAQPALGRAAETFGKPDCHFR